MGLPVYGFPMEVPITVDLRRFIPNQKACAIRNFSGSSTVRLPMIPKESFKGTLSRVVSMMKDFKNSNPGLQSAIGLERLEKISMRETLSYFYPAMKVVETAVQAPFYCGDKCTPVLSNLGLMSKSPYKFGDVEISDISVIPPVVRQPGLLLVMSTYNDILTMSIGFFEGAVCQKEIDKLLNRIKHELTGSLKT